MSIAFSVLPKKLLEPVYSPFYFVSTSSLNVSGNTNFKYVYKVVQLNPTTFADVTTLATVKLFARPDGTAIFSPARILENTLSYDAENFFQTGITSSPNSISYYKIQFGEEYNLNGYLTYSSVTNNAGFTQYNFNTPHSLAQNDIITIDQVNKFANPDYDGLQTITTVNNTTAVTTNRVYGSVASDSGSVTYRLNYSTNNIFTGCTINFAKQYGEKGKDFIAENVLGSANSKFLTTYNKPINIQTDDVYVLSCFKTGNTGVGCIIITTGFNNITKGIYLLSGNTSSFARMDVGVGTWNLSRTNVFNGLTSIIEPIYDSNVKSYNVVMCDSAFQGIGRPIEFDVQTCNDDWNIARLAFLNRRGGFSFQNFNMKQKRKLDIDRSVISKHLSHNYSIGDTQELNIDIDPTETITLNSAWLTQDEGNYLEQLFTSPVVFWLVNDSQQYFPFLITSKDYEQKRKENETLIQYQIEGRFANPTNLQRN